MTKMIEFTNAEVIEAGDLKAISAAAREGDENITGGAIGYPNHWAEFTVEFPSASVARVNEGRLFKNGEIFDLDAPENLDLITYLPVVANDQKYIAILVRGSEDTKPSNRFVETDVDTGATALTAVPKTTVRECDFVIQQGLSSPTPIKPSIAETDCCVAFVLLSTAGIVAIEPSQDHRVKTLYEVEGRVTVLEAQMLTAFARTQTLQTDLANLQARLSDYARQDVTRQLQMDMARVRKLLSLPDAARAYLYDSGLIDAVWSKTHVDWDARVDEGIRFPLAAIEDVQLSVTNPAQDGIKITDGVMLLDWSETTIIEVDGSGGTKDISQQVHTVQTPVARTVTRSSTSYGPTVAMCGNTADYSGFDSAATGQTFQRGGETFVNVGAINAQTPGDTLDTSDFNRTHGTNYDASDIVLHNSMPTNSTTHREIRAARAVIHNTWTETYWDTVTETFGINGSVYAQTFLLTQPMILSSIEVKFDRVGNDGNVQMLLVEVSPTGEPVFDNTIAHTTVEHADLSTGWVKFPFSPRYLDPGRRYAWVTVTTGNHSLRTVTGSEYTQGSLFWSTDQAWFQGSTQEDFCFKVNSTNHTTTRAQVVFDSLNLAGGMTEIRLLYESWAPEGTAMMWEVRTSGSDPWQVIQPETSEYQNPLWNLPTTCQLRLTMIGTYGLSPAIVLNENARGEARRHKPSGVAMTKVLEFGITTTSIDVEIALDRWDDNEHTFVPKIDIAGTEYTANAVTIAQDVDKPDRRIVTADFTVPSTTEARVRMEMATTDIEKVFFVENMAVYAN
ncbi:MULTISPECIES: hypothetical protein [unclassified Roseibium]|uniref:hypothetical protein n=1 Tax=unclassified Roseibium TaxID=2629323 RepID=UPI00273DF37D|nr:MULTISPECIES: hypothetical protein [unclassified Roseibium]